MQTPKNNRLAGRELIDRWLQEATAFGPSAGRGLRSTGPRYYWTAPLDLHLDSCMIAATACDISHTDLTLHCRQRLEVRRRVVVCLSGQSVGVPAEIVTRAKTLNGFIYGLQFELEPGTTPQPQRQATRTDVDANGISAAFAAWQCCCGRPAA